MFKENDIVKLKSGAAFREGLYEVRVLGYDLNEFGEEVVLLDIPHVNDSGVYAEEEDLMLVKAAPSLINCTPHPVTIKTKEGIINLPKGEIIPRLSVSREVVEHPLSEIMQVVMPTLGDVEDLPEEAVGVFYIVSALVLNHPSTSHRADLVAPGELLRDDEGNIIGCQGLTVRSN